MGGSSRKTEMFGGPQLASMVRQIPSQKDKASRIRGRAHQTPQMTDCMAGGIKDIERTITEVVLSSDTPDLGCIRAFKFDLSESSSSFRNVILIQSGGYDRQDQGFLVEPCGDI